MGVDIDHPSSVLQTKANQVATSSDVLQALFDVLWEAILPLHPAIRWEQDLNSSKFISNSQDPLLGPLLHAVPSLSALK